MNIRNFSIIAHIDHGKSTLADRMLEITKTVPERKMKEQVLDSMELERERGITIKMQPVRMNYSYKGSQYVLNLIDTPGHIDFYYEVSRSLKAVEGAILLVDATQGVQAQTLTTLAMAREAGLIIIPAVSKIDSPNARTAEIKAEVAKLLECPIESVLECSGKTGEGVTGLLAEVIEKIPAPRSEQDGAQALIFDFQYDSHRGVIVYVRMFGGTIARNHSLGFKQAHRKFIALEVGIFAPDEKESENLSSGEIGYIVTGIKEPGIASVGDTIALEKDRIPALPWYMTPKPVVWASIYPESQDEFDLLRQALGRLRLSDSSLGFEEEASGILGRCFRCGFLGMLHLEIITERLKREFQLDLIVTLPSINYEVTTKRGEVKMIFTPSQFPEFGEIIKIREPWVNIKLIAPAEYLGPVMQLLYDHEAEVGDSDVFTGERYRVAAKMPLRELMRNFFDRLKSISSGYGSLSYVIEGMRDADVVRLDIIVADEFVLAFSRVVSRTKVEIEAEKDVERLYNVLPRQLFVTKIQGQAL